jgi:hypothetical protein
MQRIKIISGVLFTILLWHIGLWNDSKIPYPFDKINLPGQFYNDWLVPNKISIGIFAGVVVLLIQLIAVKNPFKTKKKKILTAIQNHYIKSKFGGEFEKHRITIFKSKLGIYFTHRYIWKCFVANRKSHKEKGLIKYYWRNFPLPYRYYLVQYSRNGHPFPKGSSTSFIAPRNAKEVSSIVAEAFYKESPRNISLPMLDSEKIESISDFNSYNGKQKSNISKYLKVGKIESFDRLKSLHRYPIRVYADPIILENEKKWGCIVFDSIDSETAFDVQFQDFVDYGKIVQSVITNLN